MKEIRLIMGMPVTIEVRSNSKKEKISQDINKVFEYFDYIDNTYSPFKKDSEVGKLNRNEKVTLEMKLILKLCEKTKKETNGYFEIKKSNGEVDPSGLVKGWAIKNAADILRKKGYKKFYVDAGGDAEIVGNWKWGIKNPFNPNQIVKVLNLTNCGIATSGTYERGMHIYDPLSKKMNTNIVSLTVIAADVYQADRFSTPAFAMGDLGINFIEQKRDLEGYMININGIATMTSGFSKFEI